MVGNDRENTPFKMNCSNPESNKAIRHETQIQQNNKYLRVV